MPLIFRDTVASPYFTIADWKYKGGTAIHRSPIPALNCRPEKEVIDKIIGPVTSVCVTQDQCPPYIKNYRKFSVNTNQYEVIQGVGLGCLIFSGSYSFVARTVPTSAGNTLAEAGYLFPGHLLGHVMPSGAEGEISISTIGAGNFVKTDFWDTTNQTVLDTACYKTLNGRK